MWLQKTLPIRKNDWQFFKTFSQVFMPHFIRCSKCLKILKNLKTITFFHKWRTFLRQIIQTLEQQEAFCYATIQLQLLMFQQIAFFIMIHINVTSAVSGPHFLTHKVLEPLQYLKGIILTFNAFMPSFMEHIFLYQKFKMFVQNRQTFARRSKINIQCPPPNPQESFNPWTCTFMETENMFPCQCQIPILNFLFRTE